VESHPSPLSPDVIVVAPSGRLDALLAPELDRLLTQLQHQGYRRLVLNLDRTSYIGSSGLRVIITHAQALRTSQGDLIMCCLNDRSKQVLEITGLGTVLETYPVEDEATQALLTMQDGAARDADH